MIETVENIAGGVYLVRNIRTGDTYIGASIHLKTREEEHFSSLSRGMHYNKNLQKAFTPFVHAEFEFLVLEASEDHVHFTGKEKDWIEKLKPTCNRPVKPLPKFDESLIENQRRHGIGLTAAEVALRLGVTKRRVLAFIAEDRLPAQLVGMQFLIDPKDLAKFQRRKRTPGRPKGKKP